MTDHDGRHRLNRQFNPFSVLVTPLQPPLPRGVMKFTFEHLDKELAVSKEDGEKILALIGGAGSQRDIRIEAAPDGYSIEVSVV